MAEAGLVPDLKLPVKILGDGELGKKLQIVAGWFSKSACEKINAAGGTAQNAKGAVFEFPKPKKKFVARPKEKKVEAAAAAAPAVAAPAAQAAPAAENSSEPKNA